MRPRPSSPQGPAQLVIVHVGLALADAPEPGHLGGVLNFEDAWGSRRAQRQPTCRWGTARGRKIETKSVSLKAEPASVQGACHRAGKWYNRTAARTPWVQGSLGTSVRYLGP